MPIRVRIEGLSELEAALTQLPRATGKAVLRRVLRNIAQPIADDARSRAPVGSSAEGDPHPGQLRDSIGVGTKLSRRQRSVHRRMFKSDRASVEMFVGAGGVPQAHLREFGSDGNPPQAYMRPAWDAGKGPALASVKSQLWSEIRKAAARLAKKAARAARGR
jgi:HK97 gp10 family phage protein